MHLTSIAWLLACNGKSDDSVGHTESDADTDTDTDSDTDSDTDTDTDSDTDTDTDPECVPPPAGLVAWWRAEKSTADEMGVADATELGVTYAKGKVGYAFDLSAEGHAEASNVDPLYPKGSFSIEAWVQARTADGMVMALYECGGGCDSAVAFSVYYLYVDKDGHASFFVRDSDGGGAESDGQELTDDVDLVDGVLHHLVAVRNIETMRLEIYVDGALGILNKLDSGITGSLADDDGELDPFTLGGNYVGGAYKLDHLFDGLIDEASYYSVALSADQVSALYAAGSAGKCP